jgi:hypothetical protein
MVVSPAFPNCEGSLNSVGETGPAAPSQDVCTLPSAFKLPQVPFTPSRSLDRFMRKDGGGIFPSKPEGKARTSTSGAANRNYLAFIPAKTRSSPAALE